MRSYFKFPSCLASPIKSSAYPKPFFKSFMALKSEPMPFYFPGKDNSLHIACERVCHCFYCIRDYFRICLFNSLIEKMATQMEITAMSTSVNMESESEGLTEIFGSCTLGPHF